MLLTFGKLHGKMFFFRPQHKMSCWQAWHCFQFTGMRTLPNAIHSSTNNLNFRVKTEPPVTTGANATVYVWIMSRMARMQRYMSGLCAHLSGSVTRHTVCRCIHTNSERLCFYTEIPIILGQCKGQKKSTWSPYLIWWSPMPTCKYIYSIMNIRVQWFSTFFRFYHMAAFHEWDLLVLRPLKK